MGQFGRCYLPHLWDRNHDFVGAAVRTRPSMCDHREPGGEVMRELLDEQLVYFTRCEVLRRFALLICVAMVLVGGITTSLAQTVPDSPQEPKWPENTSECKDPVIMIVVGSIKAGASMREYGKAVNQSSVYSDHRGYYMAISPIEMFEGQWPANRIFLAAEFPCVEAARGMWFSKEYQERIRPLRDGCCDLTVSIHRKRPSPFVETTKSTD